MARTSNFQVFIGILNVVYLLTYRDTSYVIVDREEVQGLEPATVFLGDHPHYCYSGRFDRPPKLQPGRNIPLNLSSEDIFGTVWEYLLDKFENNPKKYRVYAELEIDASNYRLETDEHFRCYISNKKILTNQIYSDCKLVSDSGTVFPCHKEILQASSCVFAHEIAEQQMQNEDTKILVGGVGNSAIPALLDFIYFRSLVAARIDFYIAWELLKLAGKFKLKTLAISLANELFDQRITRNEIDDVIKLVAKAENYLSVDSQSSSSSETALSQVFPNVTGRNLFEDIISYVK